MFDLVFCNMEYSPTMNVKVEEINTISPVHKLISFEIPFNFDEKQRRKITFRNKTSLKPDVVIDKITNEINRKMKSLFT